VKRPDSEYRGGDREEGTADPVRRRVNDHARAGPAQRRPRSKIACAMFVMSGPIDAPRLIVNVAPARSGTSVAPGNFAQ